MGAVWTATAVLGGIGALCAVILVAASRYMSVPINKTIQKVRACLPGANCGACGFAGCDQYAEAMVADKSVKINRCIPGADAVAHELAKVLGVQFEDVVEQVAVVCCRGDCMVTSDKMNYQGIQSCAAAQLLFGGKGRCIFGCIGLGDCVKVCPNHAISIHDGIAVVRASLCSGCGLCAKTCPKGLIAMMADVERVAVTCNNREKGAATRKACSRGCIACKKCERECPNGAIAVVDNLARIDYDKCTNCGHCAEVCTVGCIEVADFTGVIR